MVPLLLLHLYFKFCAILCAVNCSHVLYKIQNTDYKYFEKAKFFLAGCAKVVILDFGLGILDWGTLKPETVG